MNNNLLIQIRKLIGNLEIKLDKTKNLQSKLEVLHKLNALKSQLTELLEIEHKTIENKYQSIINEKIKDIDKQIEKTSSKGKFMIDYTQDLSKEVLLSEANYLNFIEKFWFDVISKLNSDNGVIIKFLIQMSDTSARTLNKTELIRNTPECLENFKEIVKYNLNNVYSHYLLPDDENIIRGFIMRYKVLKFSGSVKETISGKVNEIKKGKIQRTVKIRNINYPLSTNANKFGNIQYKDDNLIIVINSLKNEKYEFNRTKDSQTIKIFKNNKLIDTIKDFFIDLDNNLFKRISHSMTHYIKNNKVILKTKEYKPKFIEKIKLNKVFTDNIFTGDIETLTKVDNKNKRYFEPYAIAFFDGVNPVNYYVTDFNSWEEMMHKYWHDLFSLKLKNTDIYFHNLSGFDVNFILKPLLNMKGVESEIMLRDDKFIQISIKCGETAINIKDSLLILPSSLMNLSKSFKIETPKEIFPRKLFESETIPADYTSKSVPDYEKYFNHNEISLESYNNYCKLFKGKIWSLKEETLKYVNIDCIALHQILIKFGNMIFNKWKIDIKHTPTLPALCFKIFRSNYMPKNTIPIITGIPYKDIKQSYTGGATDMYIPLGKDIWCYDVNSLYPTAMKSFKFPVKNFISFSNMSNLSWTEMEKLLKRKLFGFIEAEVDCPLNIEHPILQIRREISSNNVRTFSPVGTFKGWFHTEEIKEAIKLGYNFNLISGYLFEEGEIFNEYVDELYKIKMEADKNKDQVWRLISKNLLNSLYGRFGMDQYLKSNIIIDKDDLLIGNLFDKTEIDDIIELDDKLLVQFLPQNFNTYYYQENLEINISVPIASSVTAYSRILMSKFKNKTDFKLYYTDTDSLYVSFENDEARSNFEKLHVDPLKLGYLKIENPKINGYFIPFERFYFLGPKFYVAILNSQIDFSNKTKIRGLQKTYRTLIDENKIKSLLDYNRAPIKIETTKWYKDLSTSKITLESRPYNLDISCDKRSLVYNSSDSSNISLINTFPIIMKNNLIEYKGEYFIKNGKIYTEL